MENKRKIFFEIQKTTRLIKRMLDSRKTRKYVEKVTGNHGHIIGFIFDNMQKDIFQKDIEKEFNIRPSTATNMLKLMEKNGLIERKSCKEDARLKKIVLTKKSLDIQHFIMDDFKRIDEKLTSGISDEELEVFFGVLDKVNNNLKEVGTDD